MLGLFALGQGDGECIAGIEARKGGVSCILERSESGDQFREMSAGVTFLMLMLEGV